MLRFFLVWAVFVVIALPGISHSATTPVTPAADSANKEIIQQLEAAVRISNIAIEPAPKGRYMDGAIVVTLDVTNITDKTIAGIRIRAESVDVFGERLDHEYGLKTDKDIKPGETATLSAVTRGDEFLKADQTKIKKTAQAFHIVFSDGSQIKNPKYR